jgi:uncharacterized protein YndB with AHSA1/START domain
MKTKETINDTSAREIVSTRLLNAPRELVFEAWTNPEHLIKWWGPRGFSNTFHEINIKPGGVWRFIMHGPDGTDYPNFIRFEEITKPSKISFFHGEKEGDPGSFYVTATFEEVEKTKTKLVFKAVFNTVEEREMVVREYGALEGNKQTLDRLEEQLGSMSAKEFKISRVLNAPVDLVWKTHTEEKHLAHWWGPKGFKMLKTKLDLTPGGMFLYGMQAPDGSEMWGRFIYRDIIPGKKLVFVVSFSNEKGEITLPEMAKGWPREILNTITFISQENKTLVTISGYPINASADEIKMYNSQHEGMNGGFNSTYEQLEHYIGTLKNLK